MDVLDLVRDIAPDAPLRESTVMSSRERLMAGIRRPARSPRRMRRPVIIWGAAAVAAGAVVVAVAAMVGSPTPVPRSEAVAPEPVPTETAAPIETPAPVGTPVVPEPEPPVTAAATFRSAAAAVARPSAEMPAPGQYLRIESETHHLVFFDAESGWGDQYAADRVNAEGAWMVTGGGAAYAPFDQSTDWHFVDLGSEVTNRYGVPEPGIDQWALENGGMSAAPQPPFVAAGGPMPPWQAPNGEFTMVAFLAAMPTDPAAVVDWIAAKQAEGGGTGGHATVGWTLVELLSGNSGTVEQRSVMYQALALLDGTEIMGQDGNLVTIAFHRPYDDEPDRAAEIIYTVAIDLGTGRVLEMTETAGSGSAIVADDVPDVRRTFTFSVVDSVP